jgi:hypothetical protein
MEDGSGSTGAWFALVVSLAPQSPQNLALSRLSLAQAGQETLTAAPHSRQNLFPAGTSAEQLGRLTLARPANFVLASDPIVQSAQ